MKTVRFKKTFKYSPDGKSNAQAARGDVRELSEELAASAVRSGAGVIVDLDAEKAAVDEAERAEAEKAKENEINLDLDEDPKGDGKTAPKEDKSVKPAEDKGAKD